MAYHLKTFAGGIWPWIWKGEGGQSGRGLLGMGDGGSPIRDVMGMIALHVPFGELKFQVNPGYHFHAL